jgi:ADP-L-glycero-D-manno-heptose 6-epimerase
MKTNVNSFYDLLGIAKKDKAVMIYASSAATYGNLPSPQTIGKESPENPYGYSKCLWTRLPLSTQMKILN